jgi:molybdopterin synthase catalytic subunit
MAALDGPVIVTGLEHEPLDVNALVQGIRRPDCGGLVVFEGTARAQSEGRTVLRLEYEAYERRAIPQLRALAEEVAARFSLGGVVAVHRVGVVEVCQPAVVVAAAATHRAEAFAAAQQLIDRTKSEVAIWKKEVFAQGHASWVGSGS